MTERLEGLVEVYTYLSQLFQEGLETTDQEGDDVSNDIFANAQETIQKTLWMLQAELGRPSGL